MWHDVLQWSLAIHVLLIGGALLTLVLIAGMLRQQRSPAASAAWLLFMLVVSYIGIPLYLIFGTRKLAAIHARKARLFAPPGSPGGEREDPTLRYLQSSGLPPPAGADGVRVRLLLDGVGSFLLPRRRLRALHRAGGRSAWFVPVLHRPLRGRTNLRNHRKLAIVDGRRAWSGGRNIGADYLLPEHRSRWFDLSFDFDGAAVATYRHLFEADWSFASGEPATAVSPALPAGGPAGASIQAIPSGPDMAQDVLHDLLVSLVADARERVVVVSPYFVPDEVLQTMLRLAALRGVEVELILPRRSNHRLADLARSRGLRQLAAAGARVWMLPDAMLHAKAVLIDCRLALAGSANLDLHSLLLNFELMTLFHSSAEVGRLSEWVDGLRQRCRTWQPRPAGALRQTLEGLVLLAAFQL